jgi:2-polyprenyl-6-methoxyphenol hydroxylase-like FAD-dependent oxidoreductase
MYDVAIIGAGPAGAAPARLIGADGSKSKIRAQSASRHLYPQKYVAIAEWVERKNDFPYSVGLESAEQGTL